MGFKSKKPITLSKWIWRSYLKTALIPVILVQLLLFSIFVGINLQMKHELSHFLDTEVNKEIQKLSDLEAELIDHQLNELKLRAELIASQMSQALRTPAKLSAADEGRLQYSTDGAYYTASDNGGAAVYYSGLVPVGETEREKVARTLSMQSLMKDIYGTSPMISSVYLNTYDSLNVIYPYIDVINQYPPKMDIASYNFYYEADAKHNPERTARWTSVYLDPAGRGWMASVIVPIYNGDVLEGVVGIDITVSTIANQILRMDIPGGGYGIIVDGDGTILASPEKGAADWGLTELTTDYDYDMIEQDTFKPERFSLFKMETMAEFAEELILNKRGSSTITLGNEKKIVGWDTVGETGWQLILIIPQENVYVTIDQVGSTVGMIGLITTSAIVVFYSLFFYLMYRRSRNLAKNLSMPLVELDKMALDIGSGSYYHQAPEYGVKELQETANSVADMGRRLGEINSNLLEAQKELKENEIYLKAVISSIDDAIVELDENGIITNLTIDDERYTQPNDDREYTSIDTIFPSDKAALIKRLLKSVIETGKRETVETEIETGLGIRWVVARISLVSKAPVRVVVTVRDISERKKMEESISKARDDAEAANRAKSQFLSNMSHELRTPLNAVLGFAQVLEMDQSTTLNGLQEECVYEIMKAGNHLLELINEVLDLAKIEAGKTRLSIEPVDISAVIEETMTIIIPTAEKYGISVEAEPGNCSHRYVKADKTKLKQILINLLSNAIKYNKEKGTVSYYCQVDGGLVRFHVEDTGIGIPEEELEAVFKPFYRLGNSKNIIEGTGVGLAVVKQLTEMMGGVIHAESIEGKGSHFYIELPSAEEMTLWSEREEITISSSAADIASASEKKILYIEDNSANLRLVERILELIPGTTFLSAQTAEQGIEIAILEKPDVILLDINLPGMDGYEAFETLQEIEETEYIPVIAVSSNAMEREIGRAMQMGFFDYITKPIKADVFLERIKRVFGREQS